MKIYTRRALSWVLAIALLITCGISGLVLPTAAEPNSSDVVYSQDFQSGNGNWKFAGSALTTTADPADATNQAAAITGSNKFLLSPDIATDIAVGDRYIVRFKAKTQSGTKTRLMFAFYNKTGGGYQSAYYDLTTTDWMYYQAMFTAQVAATSVDFGLYLETSNVTLYVDDIQLIKVGENTNLVPGGDMEDSKSYWLNSYYNKGATVVTDTIETNNKVLHVPSGKSDLWFQFMGGAKDKIYEVSFRYRGGGITHWFSSSNSANYQNVGSVAASETWTNFRTYIQTKSTTTGNYLMIRTDSNAALSGVNDVWLDDIVVREVSAVKLPETAQVTVNDTTTLTPALTPADATLTKFTWASDNEAVATVADGVVTGVAAGTANITVTAGPLTATCAVTVSEGGGTEPPPAPVEQNLLPNGDVEQGKVKPWTDGAWSFETIGGNTMLKIPAATNYNKAYYWKGMGDIDWKVGSYLLAFDAKGDETQFQIANATGFKAELVRSIAHDKSVDSNGRWARYYVIITVSEGFTINSDWAFHFKTYRADSAASKVDTYIDNVSLTRIEDTAKPNKAEEDFDSDVLNGIVYRAIVEQFGASAGGAIVADPDNAENKVFKIPATTDAVKDYRFKFFYPGKDFFDLTGKFKYTIRYKGAFTDLEAGNATYLDKEVTTADGWTTMTKIVDLVNDASNDINWAFGIRTSTTDPIYIDYVALEEYVEEGATAIELDKAEAELEIGDTLQLNATTTPAGVGGTIEWSSDNEAVATVVDGLVTAVAAGTAEITAKLGDLTDTCTITVKAPAIPDATGIKLDKTTASVRVGGTVTLTASVLPEGAVLPTITWTSNDETVATVANGVVTAVKEGTTTITATAQGLAPVTCTVTVTAAPVADPSELFPNGDFEGFGESTPVITPWSAFNSNEATYVGKVMAGVGVDGSYGLQMGTKTSYGSIIFAGNKFELDPNTTYRLSFMANSSSVNNAVRVAMNNWTGCTLTNASNSSNFLKKNATYNGWFIYYLDFTTDDAASIHGNGGIIIERSAADTKTICFDNFSLKKIGDDAELFLGGNPDVVGDPAFSDLLAAGKVEIVTAPTATDANNKAYKVTITSDEYFKSMHFMADTVYKISFDYKGGKVVLGAPTGKSFSLTAEGKGSATAAASDEWAHFETTLNVPAGSTTSDRANWALNFYRTTTAGVLVDNFSIVKSEKPDVTSVELNKAETLLGTGASETLTTTFAPKVSKYESITWKSSNEAVATVDQNGKVTATNTTGTATITVSVKVNDTVTVTDECVVTVVKPVENFSIVQDKLHLAPQVGSSTYAYDTIELNVEPAGAYTGDLIWTSSDTEIVTVENGKVKTLKKEGTATITVTNGTVTDTIDVVVDQLGERITGGDFEGDDWNIGYWTTYIIKDGNGKLVADPKDPNNTVLVFDQKETGALWMWPAQINPGATYKLTFKAMSLSGVARVHLSNPSVPVGNGWINKTVEKDAWTEVSYIFTTNALNDGTAAALNRNYTFGFGNDSDLAFYIDDVSLVQLPPATGLSIDDATVTVRGTNTLKVSTIPAEATTGALTWKSSDANIIKVDQNGIVTAVAGEGKVTITVETADGTLSDTAEVEIVGDYITAIEMNKSRLTLAKQAQIQLSTTTTPLNGRYQKFVWTSSDETIATVDQNGLVTATDKVGSATIKVTSGDLSAECTVVVLPAATQFEFAEDTLELANNRGTLAVYKTLKLKTVPAEAFVANAQWSSSDPTVVEVDQNGKVKALAKGSAVITVTDGTISDTITINVTDAGERITGGDFEGEDWNTDKFWTNNIIKNGAGSLVTDPTDVNNTVLSVPAKMQPKWLWPALVNAGKTYKLTFRAMGGGGKAYINFSTPSVPVGNGWMNKTIKEDAWTTVSFTFTTNALDDGTAAALNRNYTIGFCSQADQTLYIDDVSLVELPPATALEIAGGESTKLYPGNSLTLSLSTTPAEATVGALTWTSSNPEAVAVDANGKVTALANTGSATITVTNPDGLTDTFEVEIDLYANLLDNGDFEKGGYNWATHASIVDGVGRDGSKGLVLERKYDIFYKGSLNVLPGTTYILSWDYLATKDAEFRIWAGSLGLTSYGSYKESQAGQWVTATKVFTTPVSMEDVNSKTRLGWILSVVSDAPGTQAPTIVDNLSLRVYNSGVEAESIKLNYDAITLLPGRTQNLGIIPTPSDANINFSTWTSSNEDVVTVENGVVTAIGKGTATVTAITANNKVATCTVTVSGEPAFIVNGTFEAANNTAWQTTEGAEIAAGVGVNGSKGGSINGAGKLSQSFTGLKPNTTYELFIRYRSAANTKLGINLLNGNADILEEKARSYDSSASWTSKKIEFKTGATLKDTTTLVLSLLSGTGPVFVDYVFIAQKAELVDLVVNDVIWDGGDEQVKPGTELLFAVTVKNQGTDSIKAGSTMMVDICVDSKTVLSFPYTFASEFTGGSTAIVMGTEPWAAVEGDHVVSARVNSTLSILEMNTENNNTVQTDLRVNDVILEVPEVAEKAGFTKLGFSDDFNSLHTIDTKGTGADGYKWYITRPYGATSAKQDDYSIEDGVITLKWDIPTYNYGFGTTDMKTNLGFQYRFGYMETRIRIPRPRANQSGEDGVPAIWSLPQSKLTGNGTRWVEMDWLEYWGINGLGSNRPEGYYTITLHDTEVDENNNQTWYQKNSNHSRSGLGDGEWHVMAWLWMEDLLIAYIDDVEVFRLSYDEEEMSSAGGMVGAFSWMNHQDLPIHIHGSRDNPLEMDYFRVWTGLTGGNKDQFEEEEEEGPIEEDNIIVDMAADEFWYNYCTDDWGDNITEVTYDNYLNVLGELMENGMYEAEYYWSKLSDERKAEINELLASNGQPTYDELLAAALAMAEKVAGGWLPEEPEDDLPGGDGLPGGEGDVDDEDYTSDSDEPESDEPEDEQPEDNAPTGATTAWPIVAAVALLVSLAALVFVRKRNRA